MRSGPGIPRPDSKVQAATPGPGSGYIHGAPPKAGGTGSMAGPAGAGTRGLRAPEGWTPTVANLVVLIALEIGAYLALRWAFRTAHGG
jgi:hypothetical protein